MTADSAASAPRWRPQWWRQPGLGPQAVLIAAVFGIVYLPDAGHGFIKDDFGWILRSRIASPADLFRVFVETGGFFRPIVALSFEADRRLFGLHPLAFGLTNVALAAACAVALYRLACALGLDRGAALLAASLWALNLHGINMAILWISGRTALLLVLFAVLAALALARGRPLAAASLALLAMLSKEEGLLLAAILPVLCFVLPGPGRPRRDCPRLAVGLVLALVIYAVLRSHSDAMTPATAPPYYALSFDPLVLVRNAAEYADRGATLAAAIALVAILAAGARPRLTRQEWSLIGFGLCWFAGGYAITVFVPVRSSLYACFPSAGAAIAAAVVAAAAWRAASARRRRVLLALGVCVPVALIPVYRARNSRWTELADFSASILDDARLLEARRVILIDDRTTRVNLSTAFGTLIPDALELTTGRRPVVWLVPPPSDAPPASVAVPANPDAVLKVERGGLVRLAVETWKPAPGMELR